MRRTLIFHILQKNHNSKSLDKKLKCDQRTVFKIIKNGSHINITDNFDKIYQYKYELIFGKTRWNEKVKNQVKIYIAWNPRKSYTKKTRHDANFYLLIQDIIEQVGLSVGQSGNCKVANSAFDREIE